MFGLPSTDMNMNVHYGQLAQQHARTHPSNPVAQRQAAYWAEVVARQQAAQTPQMPGATGNLQNPFAGPSGPLAPPSQALPAQGAPSGPQSNAGFH